jgi:eukaryotic-like serine/threonine-protein kinase
MNVPAGPPPMTCAFCHTPLPDGSRFCMICGRDLSDPEVSVRTRIAVKELFDAVKVALAGRYRVTETLGRGGMGAVFLAEDLRLGRMVAIKVLLPDLAFEPSSVGRFEREARIAAKLDHTNIIPIHAVEEVDGFHYFVMKYIAGKSLDEVLAGKTLPVDQCCRILWQAACGLGHAHGRGVIHRDVKPSNLMIDEDGRVVITDFGISRALQSETQYTSTGQVLGTPHYVSPEQALGMPLDGRSDQYSLAVVGYKALVGRLPLVAETVHVLMYKHIHEMPTPAHAAQPNIPPAVSQSIQRALSKDPDDRFPTMEEFATALWPENPVRAGQATPAPLLVRLRQGGKPTRHRLAALAVGLILLAALGAAILWSRRTAGPAREQAAATQPAPTAGEPADTAADSAAVTASTPPPVAAAPPAPEPDSAVTPAPTDPPPVKPARIPRPGPAPVPTRRTDTAPRPPPAAATTGYLTINAVPYGSVSVDGVEIGDTPIVRRPLEPGTHTVSIARPGFRTETSTVTITPGNEVRMSKTLFRDTP